MATQVSVADGQMASEFQGQNPRGGLARAISRNAGLLYVLPATILLVLITLFPFFYLVYNSLMRWNLQRAYMGKAFIGLENYRNMLADPLFWDAMRVTAVATVAIVVVQLILGMALALLFSRQMAGRRVLRSLFLLPLITTPVVVGLTWRMLFNADLGMINYALRSMGLPEPLWLASTTWALPSIIITDTWQVVPFVTLMFVAGLQSLPVEPREAATIDGASPVRIFFDITLPQLRPLIFLAMLFRVTDALRLFDLIYVMTSGGPANATQTLNLYAFKVGFTFLDIGYGSALAVALMAICIGLSLIIIRYSGLEVEGKG
ncbi:MAG: sugar ABC transporter permease [Chloroflexia bacterium]|nr:sugar ABC transporter permease [Chloroflexia bacterium]